MEPLAAAGTPAPGRIASIDAESKAWIHGPITFIAWSVSCVSALLLVTSLSRKTAHSQVTFQGVATAWLIDTGYGVDSGARPAGKRFKQ